ncbi:egf-like domain-containing protein [Holotrichia oblita]|uniref:Egf-like domain-containing protein n=1 Tax=Holotrichia oblita TaxID=644536 RepID=A0ACB9TYG3_HOLOL|nr:egf-like domain-containing protein [Holotrichia oblita]
MKRTEDGAFEGGNTAWEERKLSRYATSEVRLTEIQEKVCSELEEGKEHCYSFYVDYEDEIEKWFNLQAEHPDPYKYLCIDKLKFCCPEFFYGPPNCQPCPGFPNRVCSNKGNCTEKGKCRCEEGFTGKNCESCSKKYFESFRNETDFTCTVCPKSCEGTCTKLGCDKCAIGWIKNDEHQCVDIDECSSLNTPCIDSEFCVNTEGSYECLPCDVACSRCTGDGPDKCIKCAKTYELMDDICVKDLDYEEEDLFSIARIIRCLGVGLTTCMAYKKFGMTAALVAFVFGIYANLMDKLPNNMLTVEVL